VIFINDTYNDSGTEESNFYHIIITKTVWNATPAIFMFWNWEKGVS